MTAVQATSSSLVIPRIVIGPLGHVTVVRWGTVLGQVLRPGDRIVQGPPDSAVVLLEPRGRGRPMLALRSGRRFLALPGCVPASAARWRVRCGVRAIERDLERGAPAGCQIAVAARTDCDSPDPDPHFAELAESGGVMAARELDALCIRAAIAPRRGGPARALAAAADLQQAKILLADTPAGCLRFALDPLDPQQVAMQQSAGTVIDGPWPGTSERADRRGVALLVDESGRQLGGFRGAGPEIASSASPQVPLPLGLDTRSSA